MSILKKSKSAWSVMQKGKKVADPVAWKKGQISVDALSGFFWALLAAAAAFFGSDLENILSAEDVNTAAVAVIAVVGGLIRLFSIYSTIVSTDKLGLPGISEPDNSQIDKNAGVD